MLFDSTVFLATFFITQMRERERERRA